MQKYFFCTCVLLVFDTFSKDGMNKKTCGDRIWFSLRTLMMGGC